MRLALPAIRIVTALAALVAVIAQYRVSLAYWEGLGVRGLPGKTLDFLLFFTIESSLLAVVVLLVGAVRLLRRRPASTAWTTLRLAVVVYLFLTALVFNVLLRWIPGPPALQLEWATEVLHVIVPAVVLLDWLLAPDRRPVGTAAIGRVLAFPLAWLAVTLLRGPVTGDEASGSPTYYPYGFLDPGTSGWLSVGTYVAVLLVIVSLFTAGLAWTSRHAWPASAAEPSGAPADAVGG